MFVYAEPRSKIPTLSETAKFHRRPRHQPRFACSDALSVHFMQPVYLQIFAHSSSQRSRSISFSFNHFRTLFVLTEGVPLLPSHFEHFCRNLSPFRINTSGPSRMCCKQKTYAIAKPFRCNTYKKPGWGIRYAPRRRTQIRLVAGLPRCMRAAAMAIRTRSFNLSRSSREYWEASIGSRNSTTISPG